MSTEIDARIRTIPAREIKRRGITAVDEALERGPVHVIKNDRPAYVIMTEMHYEELVEAYQEATIARVRESLEDVNAGRVIRFTNVDDLMAEIKKIRR